MPGEKPYQNWQGRKVVGRDGGRIGTVTDLYVKSASGEPEWILVTTGRSGAGARGSFVPLGQAAKRGEDIQIPYSKRQVTNAPNIEPAGTLGPDEEKRLYRHYGFDETGAAREQGAGGGDGLGDGDRGRDAGYEREAGGRAAADDAMTLSEEEFRVGTEWHERGRVRLRKHVVKEHVTTTVPVRREEVHVEREAITDANRDAALAGPEFRESEHEVVLHEEEPVVEKRVVPKERVWLKTDTVTEERTIDDEVRKERIDMDELGRGQP